MGRQSKTSAKLLVEKKPCDKCEIDQPLKTAYYTADEVLFPDGRFHLCRTCVEEIINERGFNGFILVLRTMNKPFLQESYKDNWKDYIRLINSLPQYKNLTFDHSVFENKNNDVKLISDSKTVSNKYDHTTSYTEDEIHELSSFWGRGLSDEEIEFLQNEYEKLINAYESEDSYAMKILFQEASQQRLTIKKLRSEGKSVDKELKTLQDLLGSANIKPVQETGANATEQATFGTLIKKYENERPIPEPEPEWADVDGIKKYVQVWFLAHLCKMLGINNDYAKMYEEELIKHTVENPIYQSDEEEVEDGDVQ